MERVLRPTHTHTCAVDIESYNMSDVFSQEITIDLTGWDRAHSPPTDWCMGTGNRVFVAVHRQIRCYSPGYLSDGERGRRTVCKRTLWQPARLVSWISL